MRLGVAADRGRRGVVAPSRRGRRGRTRRSPRPRGADRTSTWPSRRARRCDARRRRRAARGCGSRSWCRQASSVQSLLACRHAGAARSRPGDPARRAFATRSRRRRSSPACGRCRRRRRGTARGCRRRTLRPPRAASAGRRRVRRPGCLLELHARRSRRPVGAVVGLTASRPALAAIAAWKTSKLICACGTPIDCSRAVIASSIGCGPQIRQTAWVTSGHHRRDQRLVDASGKKPGPAGPSLTAMNARKCGVAPVEQLDLVAEGDVVHACAPNRRA